MIWTERLKEQNCYTKGFLISLFIDHQIKGSVTHFISKGTNYRNFCICNGLENLLYIFTNGGPSIKVLLVFFIDWGKQNFSRFLLTIYFFVLTMYDRFPSEYIVLKFHFLMCEMGDMWNRDTFLMGKEAGNASIEIIIMTVGTISVKA